MTHIRQICHNFFTAQFFCSRPLFIAQFFVMKNAACVNGTIEITLERTDILISYQIILCLEGRQHSG